MYNYRLCRKISYKVIPTDTLSAMSRILPIGKVTEEGRTANSIWMFIFKHYTLQKEECETSHSVPVLLLDREQESGMEVLCSSINSPSTHCVLVEGFARTGKTTLVRSVIESGNLNTFKIILRIQLDQNICKKIITLLDIANELNIPLEQLQSEINDAASDVLIILDGISKLTEEDDWEITVLARIIAGKEFPNATKLLLTRPSGIAHMLSNMNVDHFFRIKGVSNTNSNVISQLRDKRVRNLFEEHPELNSLCQQLPCIPNLLIEFCGKSKKQSNVMITDVLTYIVMKMIKWRLEEKSQQLDESVSLFSLPEKVFDDFFKLCKFSFYSLAKNHLMVTTDQIELFLSGFNLNDSFSIDTSETFGFVAKVCTSTNPGTFSFQFVHPLVHEFLAGYYLLLIPPLDELELLRQHAFEMLNRDIPSTYWLRFFFGLAWRRNLTFDPTRYMVSTLLEFLVHCLVNLKEERYDNSILTLMDCVAETGDNDLWKKFATNIGGRIPLQITVENFSLHMLTIANMINYSGIEDWNISASDFRGHNDLRNFELYTSMRISKAVDHALGEKIHISPKISIEAASKRQKDFENFSECDDKESAFRNRFQCRAIREILQRLLKIFAEIKLKGDASNPAYVSFLSCKCFKEKLQDNIEFDPSVPYHFLEVTSEKTLKKIREENRVHMASQCGEATELVILLKPFVRRVTITIPETSEKHCIVFVSEELAHSVVSEGTISSYLSSNESAQDMTDPVISETVSTSSSEMVRPALPLPNRIEQSLRSTTVLPMVTILGTIPDTLPHTIGHDEVGPEGTRHKNVDAGESEEQDGSRSSPFYNHPPIPSEQRQQQTMTMTPSEPTSSPKSTVKEGAILFTSVPRQIPADQIHPLPDETHQMRRGGNGQIFKGVIGGMNVVYKKTNYRSREYAIITKVKHKNIVKLLAFMYGAENPVHKRRHFCYHIMPQMSGDCARMLTDKEHLTIRELQKRYEDDTRKMGVIRGNLKYLLKQVLEGLRYLHSLHIAHRDIKGSNILLNFFCSCTNPLECGCDTKYQVQICDFDAGTQLDEEGHLPPTQVGSRANSRSHYICIPVGTNGFRSPECSMSIVSNSADSFSPPITTRCDIWSLGILTTRILIGATGPTRQREIALFLLHYHRQRYMHEGLHKYNYLEVDRLVTDKLLNVSVAASL